ncbi:SMP-30/gluconolactonase/LRE family protein [Exilibacterium tricleocarpae]|uniref:SMP-30/gluconolactonase/LRE family protein n=1 Tax=Exilibacterium tricleocarpae TaxID=2591008 RepID=A0A545U4A4_9GAMM|nr:SMP-30/gluconolactonase/LRE family protein [Exilibacterium tricleocarpae]
MALYIAVLLAAYLLLWPVPVEPVSWVAPQDRGFTGAFAPNQKLAQLDSIAIGDYHGPEGVALGADGTVYTSTHEGWILRLAPGQDVAEPWLNTGGRPLGMDFDRQGNLIVADAFIGLLSISADGRQQLLANTAAGVPIRYANGVAVAGDGKIYFSDSSTKFSARAIGGTYEASLLDILEHGGHGRLLVFDPQTRQTRVLVSDLNFANGVALAGDDSFILINETSKYRVLKHWLAGEKAGQTQVLIDNLPGFPDNLGRGLEGRFWLGLASPRNRLLDRLADKPWLRTLVQRLPAVLRPQAVAYSHIVAIDGQGEVVVSLQDPDGGYAVTTGAAESVTHLYISSLVAPVLARVPKSRVGL